MGQGIIQAVGIKWTYEIDYRNVGRLQRKVVFGQTSCLMCNCYIQKCLQ
jgi:hypothetical protein